MAILTARRLTPALVALALGGSVVVLPHIADAAPHSKPSVADVQKKLGKLALSNTQLVEKYNQARIATAAAKKAAGQAQKTAAAASATYEAARGQYVQIVRAQYESSAMGAAGALLESDSGSDYLDRVQSLGIMSTRTSQVLARIGQQRDLAATAATAAQKAYVTAQSRSAALTSQRKDVTAQISKYQTLLNTLNDQQRAAFVRAQNPSVAFNKTSLPTPTSAAAKRAVNFALDQLGKPYVFGAAGPDSWDCSGLTMMAWQAGGVSLPHSAADQYNYGKHVSLSNLSPGDLIFMYQPIGHVTIYIGDGYMVSAPTEGEPVTVVPVNSFSSDIVGATHLG